MREKTGRVLRNLKAPAGVVLGVRSSTGLSALRSLGSRGVTAVAVDSGPTVMGRFSRYCSAYERYRNDDDLLSLLVAMGDASPWKNALFCESDALVLFIDRHREKLSELYHLFLTDGTPIGEIINKKSMLRLAREAGLAVPPTFCFPESTVAEAVGELRFPLYVKPPFSRPELLSKGLVVHDESDLAAAVGMERFAKGCLVQEIVVGREADTWFCMGYRRPGAPPAVSMVTGHKVHCRPPEFGLATRAVTGRNAAVEDRAHAFLGHIGYRGFFELEFIKSRDGEYVFIEINPRLSAIDSIFAAAGTGLAYLAYRDACGLEGSLPPRQRDGVVWIDIINDFDTCFRFYRRQNGNAMARWARGLGERGPRAVYDGRDPVPFLLELAKYVVKSFLRLIGRRR